MSKSKLRPDQIRAAQRLREIWQQRKREGLVDSQQNFADKIKRDGWSQALIAQHLNGITPIGVAHVAIYTEYLKIDDPYEIASDDVKTALSQHDKNMKRVEFDPQLFVMVTLHASQNWHRESPEEEMEEQEAVAFLRAYAEVESVDPKHLKAFRVLDDAMAGQIRDRDTVIGRTDRLDSIIQNCIYAFELHGKGYIRRLDEQADGALLVSSDNFAFGERPYTIPTSEQGDLLLIGEIFHRSGATK